MIISRDTDYLQWLEVLSGIVVALFPNFLDSSKQAVCLSFLYAIFDRSPDLMACSGRRYTEHTALIYIRGVSSTCTV